MDGPPGDLGRWDPLTPQQVAERFAKASFPWWIAGGWAIDLFVGRQTRPHGDVDVVVLHDDQGLVQSTLTGWDLWAAEPPGTLRPWLANEILPSHVHDIWCRRGRSAPWCLQLMIVDRDGDRWLFRRDPRVSIPLSRLGRRTADSIPYLAAEIQLLFKAKGRRRKDEQDFATALPLLDEAGREWLKEALELTMPGHPWIAQLGI
jgi:hypothetical protein